jgi:hypothetical protein
MFFDDRKGTIMSVDPYHGVQAELVACMVEFYVRMNDLQGYCRSVKKLSSRKIFLKNAMP